jgi:hypothetical protein
MPGEVVSYGSRLHVGSSRPHTADGAAYVPELGGTHAGGLRQLEPELKSVLLIEPLPSTNEILRTDPEEPPSLIINPPGPFTDEELLPDGLHDEVVAFGNMVVQSIARGRRGGENAWRVAKSLRPEARTYTEERALRPAARGGHTYRKEGDGLWHAIQPSRYPQDPPDTAIDIAHFEELAKRWGLLDGHNCCLGSSTACRARATCRCLLSLPPRTSAL